MLKNKKAEIGETITWVVATLIIIAALIIFLFLSSLLAKIKTIEIGDVKSDFEDDSHVLPRKTQIAHQILENKNREIIDKILEKKNE
jgi:hypothetical protein